MPISRATFGQTTLILLAVSFLALLAIAAATVWLVDQTRSYAADVATAQKTRAALVDVRSLLQDAETGQRGFLLTGDAAYLEPYRLARERLPAQVALADSLLAADSDTQAAAAPLAGLAVEKLAELGQTVDLATAGDRAAALAIVRSDRGKLLMDQVRGIAANALGRLDASLKAGTAALARSGQALLIVTAIGLVLLLLMAVVGLRVAFLYTRDLERARLAVEEANAGLEERVQERTAELEALGEEVQRFAYIVSHDLRAPLVNVMGFTAELEVALKAIQALVAAAEAQAPALVTADARTAAAEDLPEAIRFIRSSTERMDRLINAILRLAREGRRALTPERVRMEELIKGLAATVRHQLDAAGAELAVAIPMPDVISDRLALEQVFGNLIDNAVKYLDPARPGRLAVRGRREQGGRRVVYEIEDNGRGIALQDRERIFELFRRSGAQDRPGEGIGLAHVRALVRRLGGAISCRSLLGQGSVFMVSLPASIRAAEGTVLQGDTAS